MALILAHVERPLIPLLVLHVLALMLVIIMSLQPKAKEEVAFKVSSYNSLENRLVTRTHGIVVVLKCVPLH